MPRALKWGILIIACMLLLFVVGRIFQDHFGELLGKFYNSSFLNQETEVPFSESLESLPWEAEIHSMGVDENN